MYILQMSPQNSFMSPLDQLNRLVDLAVNKFSTNQKYRSYKFPSEKSTKCSKIVESSIKSQQNLILDNTILALDTFIFTRITVNYRFKVACEKVYFTIIQR